MNEKVIITVTSCWELKSFEGVNPMDAFWKAFVDTDIWGVASIEMTFRSIFTQYKNDPYFLSQLVMMLNNRYWLVLKSKRNFGIILTYQNIWNEVLQYAENTLQGGDLQNIKRMFDFYG